MTKTLNQYFLDNKILQLSQGEDVQDINECIEDNPPLHHLILAYRDKRIDQSTLKRLFQEFIELQADINGTNVQGETLLFVAITFDEPWLVQYLLDQGVDPRIAVSEVDTVFTRATRICSLEIVEMLFPFHDDADPSVKTILQNRFIDLIEDVPDNAGFLIEKELVDLSEENEEGYLPFHVIVAKKNRRLFNQIKSKLDHGAQSTEDKFGNTALHVACDQGWPPFQFIIRYLIETLKLSVNQANEEGDTPLHCAARHGHVECAKYLLQQGANPNCVNHLNQTPASLIMQQSPIDIEILQLFSSSSEKMPRFFITKAEIISQQIHYQHHQGLWIRCLRSGKSVVEAKRLKKREGLTLKELSNAGCRDKPNDHTFFRAATFVRRKIPIFLPNQLVGLIIKQRQGRQIPHWYDGQHSKQAINLPNFHANEMPRDKPVKGHYKNITENEIASHLSRLLKEKATHSGAVQQKRYGFAWNKGLFCYLKEEVIGIYVDGNRNEKIALEVAQEAIKLKAALNRDDLAYFQYDVFQGKLYLIDPAEVEAIVLKHQAENAAKEPLEKMMTSPEY